MAAKCSIIFRNVFFLINVISHNQFKSRELTMRFFFYPTGMDFILVDSLYVFFEDTVLVFYARPHYIEWCREACRCEDERCHVCGVNAKLHLVVP